MGTLTIVMQFQSISTWFGTMKTQICLTLPPPPLQLLKPLHVPLCWCLTYILVATEHTVYVCHPRHCQHTWNCSETVLHYGDCGPGFLILHVWTHCCHIIGHYLTGHTLSCFLISILCTTWTNLLLWCIFEQ